MITQVQHTGFAVEDLAQAVTFYKKLGFETVKEFEKPEPRAHVVLMEHPHGSGLELWQFIDKQHPQVAYISRHIAVASDDFENDINAMTEAGYELVIPITQGVIMLYAYVRDPSGNCIEITKA